MTNQIVRQNLLIRRSKMATQRSCRLHPFEQGERTKVRGSRLQPHAPESNLTRPLSLAKRGASWLHIPLLSWILFPFAVVPKAKLCTRTDSAGAADDYAKEFAQKMFRRIHAQFPA